MEKKWLVESMFEGSVGDAQEGSVKKCKYLSEERMVGL